MRRSLAAAVVWCVFAFGLAGPAHAGTIVRNPGNPEYVVSLRGDSTGRVWTGTEQITFTNLDSAPLSTIYLRLWSNGVLGCSANSIVVTGLSGGTTGPLALNCTELPVTLDTPLAPNGYATISMHIAIHVPVRNDRFGSFDGLSLVGTALPTLAVSDDLGWHLDPFIDLGESFYSIVGDYLVTLDVPKGLDTPTTGEAVAEKFLGDRRITIYQANSVRDFEWAAGRLQQLVTQLGQTRIVVSYRPGVVSKRKAQANLGYARRSMDTFSRSYGAFPYPEMDVVLTGFSSFGGMEYPTIVFTNPNRYTVSHELSHQWWYGVVGDNQFAAPWLDESFATWSQFLPYGGRRACKSYKWPSNTARITNDMAYWNDHPDEYGTVYRGGGCLLANLASQFGLDRFVQILRAYARTHWLGISTTADFKEAIDAAAAQYLPAFDPTSYWSTWRVD